jgi:hypothetical protein
MGAMRSFAVALAALALAPAATAAPLSVHATIDRQTADFAAPVHTRVTVVADPTIRVSSIRVVDDVSPLTSLGAPVATRDGNVVTVVRTAACLDDPCVAENRDANVSLPRVRVTATTTAGRTVHATAPWPVLGIHGRVTKADLARARPPFHADTSARPVSYRVAPSTLAWLLDAAAGVLALAAILLAVQAVRTVAVRRRAAVPVDELGRALRLTREAEARPVPDRRRALGLLAHVLGEPRLAARTNGLAWARPTPEPAQLESIADDVEREVRRA